MSNSELFDIIDNPLKELMTVKIGLFVRATLPEIISMELISDLEIKNMQRYEYSKLIFDMNYPVLKKIDENHSILENRKVDNYTRYYADPVINQNSKYLISSEWYDRNQEYYIKWLKRKVKRDSKT